jgi:hypothetical protein
MVGVQEAGLVMELKLFSRNAETAIGSEVEGEDFARWSGLVQARKPPQLQID